MQSAVMLAVGVLVLAGGGVRAQQPPPPEAATYLPFFVDYAEHAERLWHEHGDGGYWGDGAAGGNGGVRGTSNLTLAYAMLVLAEDRGWVRDGQLAALAALGLDRGARLGRVRASWRYLAAGHVTGNGACADHERWGRSWQSSLWVGASGLAALLVWDDLDAATRALVERVVVDEADQKIGVEPRDAKPGNTAAEENGWDTNAPAIAVALFPRHPRLPDWLRAAQVLAANTYSTRADHSSDAALGEERVRDVVSTTNLFDDFTLDNHGFFHPSYLRVAGQELGEALVMLELGDLRHGTAHATRFRPYALHHLADTWQVMRRLLLPEGEVAYPSGSDWAIHLPSSQSYYAFVATTLGDPVAALAERRAFTAARMRKRASSGGRFLGATNFEWWWEPIALKRYATAMLQHTVRGGVPPADGDAPWGDTVSWWSEPAGVFVHRTPQYFASVSTREQPTGLVIPLGPRHLDHPYVTTPRVGALLPAGTISDRGLLEHELGAAILLRYTSGASAAVIALRDTVLFVADDAVGELGIQNDNVVTGDGRRVSWDAGARAVPPLTAMDAFIVSGSWLGIDDQLGLVNLAGFDYRPAGGYTRRSAAEDLVAVRTADGLTCLQVIPRASADATAQLAHAFVLERDGRRLEVRCQDGLDGVRVRVVIELPGRPRLVCPELVRVGGDASDEHPSAHMVDGDPSTFAVLTSRDGAGPTPGTPIELEFQPAPAAASPTALRITPRPRYGPREITLMVHRAGGWQRVAQAEVGPGPIDLDLPAHAPGARYKLAVTRGWDRGERVDAPRNTQIAELAFVAGATPDPAAAQRVPALELHVVERGDR